MKVKIYRSLLMIPLMFLSLGLANVCAQQRIVKGVIKDREGIPMPGVSVLIKGTSKGAATDLSGAYSLEALPTDILVVSYLGYQSEELEVGERSEINLVLFEDITALSEIVVVGYGTQKKVLNTGANLQVKGDKLQKMSTTNALQALQGQAPGVQISSTSGQPGEGMKVVIRGMGTIGNSGPLYVVDGVLTGDISYLSNADIESIDVLKDAASAAIYGSQAANGVVLVTTKSGKKGSGGSISFDSFYGIQNAARKTPLLNSKEYATMMNEAAVNSGKLPYYTLEQIDSMGTGTDWLDQMFVDDAVTQSYSIGITGSSQSSTYSASLGYLSQEGVVGGKDLSYYERYNFRINSEHNLYSDIITFGQHLSFAYVNNNGVGVGNQFNNTLRGAFSTTPFLANDASDTVGMFNQANPYYSMVNNNQNTKNNQKLLGDVYLQIEPLKGLKFRSSLGLEYNANESNSFVPEYTLSVYSFNNDSKVTQSMGKGRTLIWDNLLSYGMDLTEEHRLDAMLGSSAYDLRGSSMWASNTNLIFTDLEHAWLSNATNTDGTRISLGGEPYFNKRMSYFGRLNYNFRESYMLNVTFRADGSSQFAKDNRWGYYPSVSAGWVISNEGFMDNTSNWLNFLKLRASWGQVGNQNADAFQYLAPVTFAFTNYTFGTEEGILVSGAYPSRLANPGLKWETSEQTNIGFDAQMLSGKLSANLDLYSKTTKDWLIRAPILATAGADAPWINGGDVNNRGIELALSYADRMGDLGYTININGAYNKNKVGNIPTADGIVHGLTNQLYDNSLEFYRAQSGYPIGYFWGLSTNGIFQSEEEVASHTSSEGELIQPNAQPGDVRYIDRNDDGVINDLDRDIIGNPNPDYTFGFSITTDYKGFDFSVQTNGVAGNQLVQSYRNQSNQYGNYTTAILDRWHGPGSSNSMPRVTENNNNWTSFSDLYIHDGDFLRISNVTLGYDFTKKFKIKGINQLRLYASALNLYTFTKYEGMDPEIGYGVESMSQGVDLGYYPRPRTFMLGLNVKF